MRKGKYLILAIGFSLIFCVGCHRVADAVIDGVVDGTSRAASDKAEQEVYESLAPKGEVPAPQTQQWNFYMATHARVLFNYTFAPGGVWVSRQDYQPGEYTKYQSEREDEETDMIIEKAFLEKLDNGNEWWRVSWKDDEEKVIYEALIDTSGQMIKLLAQDSEGNKGEIRVQGQRIYRRPNKVSDQEINQSRVETETVSTPAGTFETDKIKYTAITNEGQDSMTWWLSPEIPGGVVKYQFHDDNERVWNAVLIEKGQGAERKLTSF